MPGEVTPIWTSWTQLIGACAAMTSALVTIGVLVLIISVWRDVRNAFRSKVKRLEELVKDLEPSAAVIQDAADKATVTLKESEKILSDARTTLTLIVEHQELIHRQRDDIVGKMSEVKEEVKGVVKEVKEIVKKDGSASESGTSLPVVRVEREWVPGVSPERRSGT